jgi:tetratricopeptide (TPR) repeat protein
MPSLAVLVCHPGSGHRPSPAVSSNEICCGPDLETVVREGRYRSLATPIDSYDLRAVAAALPEAQRPELIVVATDGTGRQQPRNLDAFPCPRVLVVGDLQRGAAPLRAVLRYAGEEAFDLIVLARTRQHAHFFAEAGFPDVAWIPGWGLVLPRPSGDGAGDREPSGVVLVGEVDAFHAHRLYVLQALQRAGVVVQSVAASPEEAAKLHAQALINLNCSVGGELNPRIFAVLASGGFLLTDRLSSRSGLETLFRDGEHLVCYDGVEDLQQKIEHYLGHPGEARRIARAGHAEYLAHHQPARKAAQLLELLRDRQRTRTSPGALDSALELRLAVHEQLQELHRSQATPAVLFADGVDPRLVADATDLPRLRILLERGPAVAAVEEALRARGVAADRVSVPGEGEVEGGLLAFDALVAPAEAIAEGRLDELVRHTDSVLVGNEVPPARAVALDRHLRARGFERSRPTLPTTYQLRDEVIIGERHFAAGEPEEAAKHFQAALTADPESVRALNDLGVVSYLFGEKTACLQFLDSALSLDRRDPETLLNLAETKLQLGDAGEARRLHGFLERRSLGSAALEQRREALRAELQLPAPSPAPAAAPLTEFRMAVPPSLRRLRIASLDLDAVMAERLVVALLQLAGKGLDFRCTLAAAFEEAHPLRRRIREADLESRFEFAEAAADERRKDLFARSNVLVVPSFPAKDEPGMVREAMAAGLAVVSETASEEALAGALEALSKDRERWRRLAKAGERQALAV